MNAAKAEHKPNGGLWTSTLAFQNAAYDKICLITPGTCRPELLQAKRAFAFPLFERFLPTDMRPWFPSTVMTDTQVLWYREGVADSGHGTVDARLQAVLDIVKEVSDHVPVVLDLEIHRA